MGGLLGRLACIALALVSVATSSAQVGPLLAWGNNSNGETDVPAGNFRSVTACGTFSVAIREDGTLAAWGGFGGGQLNVPAGTFLEVSAGAGGGVGLRTDGTLASWGRDDFGLVTNTPTGTFTAVASSDSFRLARRTTGELVRWGMNSGLLPQGNVIDFDGGSNFGLAVLANGTLVGWGENNLGSLNLPAGSFTAVEAGLTFGAAIAADGSLRSWGSISTPGGNLPMPPPPPGNDFVDIDAGVGQFVIARRANGTIAAWGSDWFGVLNVPGGAVLDAAAAHAHGVAIIPTPGAGGLLALAFILCTRARRERDT
jgi:alpha-tubulin suppressor-like RCC1 family protein